MRTTTLLTACAAAAALLTTAACSSGGDGGGSASGGGKSLHIYAWAGEIPDSVVKGFQQETGIKVTLDTFDSNETMTAKLSAGGADYDLVEPSQYALQQLVGQKLVQKLDHSRIKGLDNLAPKFRDPSFDPGNAYSIPWIWGTTGLAYNEDCTGRPVDSWKALFDGEYKGKTYMLDNMLAAYIAGLQVNGYRATSTDPAEIQKATDSLKSQKAQLAGYNSTNYPQLLATGQACVAEAWSGTAMAKVVESNKKVHYTLPTEGGSLWTDNLSVTSRAKNIDAAYEFINYTLRPEVAALVTDDGSSASTNQAARSHIKKTDLLSNPAVYAPDAAVDKADFLLDPGQAMQLFQQGWMKIKAS
ncbi:PotD/PotF family extracellular solute-binding protein [Streptomyces sp. NPDC092296]|uniref:ABC transporter substrate-binding protein n=1 Tax=Streptomyces sp. NPDC092296 TaxID=3366012 RepID=UPI00382163C2